MFPKTLLISLALGVLSVNALKFTREPTEYSDLDSNGLKRELESLVNVRTKPEPKPETSDEPEDPLCSGVDLNLSRCITSKEPSAQGVAGQQSPARACLTGPGL